MTKHGANVFVSDKGLAHRQILSDSQTHNKNEGQGAGDSEHGADQSVRLIRDTPATLYIVAGCRFLLKCRP